NSGAGNDTVNVSGSTGPLTVNTGAGNDVINVGDVFNTLEELQGALAVNGQDNNDTLNVNDQGAGAPHTYTITSTTVQRSGAATITYSGIEGLFVHKGPSRNPPPLVKGLAFTNAVRAAKFATLSGRLADANAHDHLSLVVDWGDGSAPVQRKPDRK